MHFYHYNKRMEKIVTNLPERIIALRSNQYFSDLQEIILAQLSQGTYLRRYARGEAICWQGEPCTGLYIIRSGSIKLFKLSPKGRELIIRVFETGATFNEVPVFDSGPNPVNAAALEESEIWIVDAQVIRKALRQNPEMAELVILNLSHNLRTLVKVVEELSFYQVTNRLARLIFTLPPEQLTGTAAQRITQDQLAARLGTVREVVARSLRDLERSGAIQMRQRQIYVVNESLLRDWAQEPMN